jgi:hypothetical protein
MGQLGVALVRLLLGALMVLGRIAVAAPVIDIDSAVAVDAQGVAAQVRLPDSWNRGQRSGTWTYVLEFSMLARPDEPWGLYVPRVGNRAVVSLNGHVVGRLGRLEGDQSDYAQRPHLFFLSPATLQPGRNELRFVVQGEQARYAGLSRVHVGPVDAVQGSFALREALTVWGSFAVVLVSLVFALIAAVLGTQARDKAFAIFCAACVLCAVRTSYAVVVDPPMNYRLWSALMDGSYAGYLACLCLFCVSAMQLRRRWIVAATGALALATVILLPAYAWWRVAMARQILLGAMVLYAMALCVTVVLHWWRHRSTGNAYVAAAGAISVALAIHDHIVVFYTTAGYESVALARYSLVIFVVAMGGLLVERYTKQVREEAKLRAEVAAELSRRTEELERHFDRQQQLAARAAHDRERQLLMQDLHDGMGLQLNGLLGMVQSGPLERNELTREVRTAIEQMRMLLDSAAGFEGDVSMLLGDIRYRIEQRLQRSGIRLQWVATLAAPSRVMAPQHAIALQRLVFELVTNTLKHSGATLASFHANDADGGLTIVYADNGRGFAAEAGAGVGTRSMQRRAADLGATLERSAPAGGGLRYELAIPAAAFVDPQEWGGAGAGGGYAVWPQR